MYLLVKCIGEFYDVDEDGLVLEGMDRFISLCSGFYSNNISPKADDIGYNVGGKWFDTNAKITQWEKEKYVLLTIEWTYKKSGDWLNSLGDIVGIKIDENEVLEELLK